MSEEVEMKEGLIKTIAMTNANLNNMEVMVNQIRDLINGDKEDIEKLGAIQFFDDISKVVNVLVQINNRNGHRKEE